jgi:hypothetical protein
MKPFSVWVGDYFFFLSGRCVSADAATLLASLLALGSRKTFEASEPIRLDVVSFSAIFITFFPLNSMLFYRE